MRATTFARRTILLAGALAACAAGASAAGPGASGAAMGAGASAAGPGASQSSSTASRPRAAAGAPSASLAAAFEPERLGRRTTLSFGFRIVGPGGLVPSALTEIDFSYPENLGIALSGLGLATCTAGRLEASGLAGCQANSIMGLGHALAEISLGSNVVAETVPITILRAPDEEGHIALLFNAVGSAPLNTTAVFAGALLPADSPFGGRVSIKAPLIESLPGAPDVSIVSLHATIGPSGVTYYEQVQGNTLAYQPPGILLPDSCPKGGFPFAAQFSFVDGSRASARATEPCPGGRRHGRSASRTGRARR